jgi:hypothetical protein
MKNHQKTNQTISKNGYKDKQISKRKIYREGRKANKAKKCMPKETCIKTKNSSKKSEKAKTVD